MPAHDESWVRGVPGRMGRARRLARGVRRTGVSPALPRDPSGPRPDGALTTVDATIRPVGTGRYRRLDWSAGEPHLVRDDLGVKPSADRVSVRRSLLYFAQHTDVHVCDAQTPSRLESGEAFGWVNPGSDGGHRPQETCTTQVLDRLVAATNAVAESPLSGARMAWCIQTGDNTDNRGAAELKWWTSVLDGRPVTPNSGLDGRYEGVQRSGWKRVWHPDRAGWDKRSRAGFPHLPGFLDAAVSSFFPVGLDVPWLAVFGNHDLIFQGSFGPTMQPRLDLVGAMLTEAGHRPVGPAGLARAIAVATSTGGDTEAWERQAGRRWVQAVAADAEARRPVTAETYIDALLGDTTAGDVDGSADPVDPRDPTSITGPGPVGHGFTAADRDAGRTWWSRPEGDHIQLIGLDTCNHLHGDGGGIGPRQWEWLQAEIERCQQPGQERMVILFSHHSTWTLTNAVDDPADPGPRVLAEEIEALLGRSPNVVLWVNGHTHQHRVLAHAGGTGGGWWEVNTASGIDFGQQGRTIELFDNGDGTVSIVATVIDHLAPPRVAYRRDGRWEPTELASMSRELSANDDQWLDPLSGLGRTEDRNVELLVTAPFPLG